MNWINIIRVNYVNVLLLVALFLAGVALAYVIQQNKQQQETLVTHKQLKENHDRYEKRAETLTRNFVAQTNAFHKYFAQYPTCVAPEVVIGNNYFEPSIPFTARKVNSTEHFLQLENHNAIAIFLEPSLQNTTPVEISVAQNTGIAVNINHKLLMKLAKNSETKKLQVIDFYVLAGQRKTKNEEQQLCQIPGRLHIGPTPLAKNINHELVNMFGRLGQKWGRFTLPYGTDYRPDTQQIVVSDCSNALIQEFTQYGQLTNIFGSKGDGPAMLNTPADVKFHNNQYYVVEERNHRYQIFDQSGEYVSAHGSFISPSEAKETELSNELRLNNPLGIALDDEGFIFVVDYGNDRIQKITPDGKPVKVFGNSEALGDNKLRGPYYIDFHAEKKWLYITDRSNDRVVVFDKQGEFQFTFPEPGSDEITLNYPHELHIDEHGDVWIADTNNYRVLKFSAMGKHLDTIDFTDSFDLPKTVLTTPEGLIFIGHIGKDSYITTWRDKLGSATADLWKQPRKLASTTLNARFGRRMLSTNTPIETSIYGKHCAACHASGSLGAPRTKVEEDWQRFPRDMDTLMALAKEGKGAMLPKGGCDTCSNEELRQAILFMLPVSWDTK